MIVPSAAVKILGFKDKNGNVSKYPHSEENEIECLLDNGSVKSIKIAAKNGASPSSFKEMVRAKETSIVKADTIQNLAFKAFELQPKDAQIAQEIERYMQKSGGQIAEAIKIFVKKRLYDSIRIQSETTIRLSFSIKSMEDAELSSLMIREPSEIERKRGVAPIGLYWWAVSPNKVPVKVQPILSKDGQFFGNYLVCTHPWLTSKRQMISLLEHAIRTINRTDFFPAPTYNTFQSAKQAGSALLPEIEFLYKMSRYVKKEYQRTKQYPQIDKKNVINALLSLINKIGTQKWFPMELVLPLKIDQSFLFSELDAGKGQQSPLKSIGQNIAKLNYHKYDPNVKREIANIVEQEVQNMLYGLVPNGHFLATYYINSYNIIAPWHSEGYGFMQNNLQLEKSMLPIQFVVEHIFPKIRNSGLIKTE